jgi:hypothetical protein
MHSKGENNWAKWAYPQNTPELNSKSSQLDVEKSSELPQNYLLSN